MLVVPLSAVNPRCDVLPRLSYDFDLSDLLGNQCNQISNRRVLQYPAVVGMWPINALLLIVAIGAKLYEQSVPVKAFERKSRIRKLLKPCFKILDLLHRQTIIATTSLVLVTFVGLSGIIKYVEQLRKSWSGTYDLLPSSVLLFLLLSLRYQKMFFPMAALLGALIGLGMLGRRALSW